MNDPTASLSAERRGTISLPDIESSFSGGRARYTIKAGIKQHALLRTLRGWLDAYWAARRLSSRQWAVCLQLSVACPLGV